MIGQYFHIRSGDLSGDLHVTFIEDLFVSSNSKLKVKQAIYFIYAQRFPRLVGSRKGEFKVIK